MVLLGVVRTCGLGAGAVSSTSGPWIVMVKVPSSSAANADNDITSPNVTSKVTFFNLCIHLPYFYALLYLKTGSSKI